MLAKKLKDRPFDLAYSKGLAAARVLVKQLDRQTAKDKRQAAKELNRERRHQASQERVERIRHKHQLVMERVTIAKEAIGNTIQKCVPRRARSLIPAPKRQPTNVLYEKLATEATTADKIQRVLDRCNSHVPADIKYMAMMNQRRLASMDRIFALQEEHIAMYSLNGIKLSCGLIIKCNDWKTVFFAEALTNPTTGVSVTDAVIAYPQIFTRDKKSDSNPSFQVRNHSEGKAAVIIDSAVHTEVHEENQKL